jgi:predicted negative regulator of RcsB-dependent stress response
VKYFGKHNPLILALAIIGAFAVIYVGWTFYQRETAEEQRRAFFSATPAPGMPDLSKPEPPPPQP